MIDAAAIAARLVAEKELLPAAAVELPAGLTPPDLAFVGLRGYWGSVMSVGLTLADGLTASDVTRQAAGFYAFTHALLPLAGRLTVGPTTTRLGSFGLLAFVFSRGGPGDLVETIVRTKHGSAFRKDYAVCWALDLPGRAVHAHRGLPLTMFPGRRYLRRVLADT